MVKIDNPLGDVKVGRQGEAVYQRKYGRQIRRTVSPKRALASEAQIAHRQLYRAALAWRSQLSLANRRYLDGYCISNWIVDNYQIPLPWSRFALKLYLEKVKFLVIQKPTVTETEQEGKHQAYDNEADLTTWTNVYKQRHPAQTFKPSADLELTKIGCFLKRIGGAITLHVRIYETDIDGHPTGSPLVSGNFPYGSIPFTEAWCELDIAYPLLNSGQLYALKLYTTTGSGSQCNQWKYDPTNATYPNGCMEFSNDYGVTWVTYPTYDFGFRIYGKWIEKSGEPGLLHIRQPALLAVEHKRNGLIVNEWDTLSSLDEEYLTGQVGLDILYGDSIKATTLPGIDYSIEV